MEAFHDLLLSTLGLDAAAPLRASNYASDSETNPRLRHSGRYARDYLYPASYAVRVSDMSAPPGSVCHWRVGPTPAIATGCIGAMLAVPANAAGTGADQPLALAIGTGPERTVAQLAIADRLIVAMGDSYISGEGNPDVPAAFHTTGDTPPPAFASFDWAGRIHADTPGRIGAVRPAQWWDGECHRSLLSWPVLASFVAAARHPHDAVTLVHLGCSGDEIDDGLLSPRRSLPGGGHEIETQLRLLRDLRDRRGGAARPVDRLLLSIGGNDIGFGGVVANLLIPKRGITVAPLFGPIFAGKGNVICPYAAEPPDVAILCGREAGQAMPRRSAQTRLSELPGKLNRLAAALTADGIASGTVEQTSYPNPLVSAEGTMCRTGLDPYGLSKVKADPAHYHLDYANEKTYADTYPLRVRAGFEGMIYLFPLLLRSYPEYQFQLKYYSDDPLGAPIEPATAGNIACDWDARPSDSELCQAYWVWGSLNRVLGAGATAHGWTLLDAYQDRIRGHGWCDTTAAFRLKLPVADRGRWRDGWKPSDFRPYDAALPRWFRTVNDSLLTQFGDVPDLSGTFHPTFQAHLAIADAALSHGLGIPGD